jgi:hypothetical protein
MTMNRLNSLPFVLPLAMTSTMRTAVVPCGRVAGSTRGTVIVVVHGPERPSDTDWNGLLHQVQQQVLAGASLLIYTEGGQPTAEQELQLSLLLAWAAPRTAFLCDIVRLRERETSRGRLFTRAFKGSEVEEALRFLLVPTERVGAIRETLQRLVTELHATGRPRSSRALHDGPAARPAPGVEPDSESSGLSQPRRPDCDG